MIECPRCQNGRMFRERDRYSAYMTCGSCGYVKEDTPPLVEEPRDTRDDRGTKVRPRHGERVNGVRL